MHTFSNCWIYNIFFLLAHASHSTVFNFPMSCFILVFTNVIFRSHVDTCLFFTQVENINRSARKSLILDNRIFFLSFIYTITIWLFFLPELICIITAGYFIEISLNSVVTSAVLDATCKTYCIYLPSCSLWIWLIKQNETDRWSEMQHFILN